MERLQNKTRRRPRLLVVEDERIVALDLRATLEDLGYDVVALAASADEAVRAARVAQPDLVFMDVRLEGEMDGIQAAALLHEELGVPVVFLTANADEATLQRALTTTPAGFLTKPFDERVLRRTIEVALQQHAAVVKVRTQNEFLKRVAVVDGLTGLHNRRHLETVLSRELAFAKRDSHAVGVVMIDLDHFKRINDEHGHAAGDSVLRGVADAVRSRLRVYDIACRYGGEELVVIAPGASALQAAVLAESLREIVAKRKFMNGGDALPPVTASFGVAAFPEHGDSTGVLLGAADAALYRAKAEGRNRVVVAE